MSWNHRVVGRRVTVPWRKVSGVWYEIREAFYDKKGRPNGVTVEATSPGGDSVQELRCDLLRMLRATYKPVLKESETFRKKKGKGK